MMKSGRLETVGNYLTTAYLFLMFCVYPFYMEEGYSNIGKAKNRFFLCISLAAFLILLLVFGVQVAGRLLNRRRKKEAYLIDWDLISYRDLLLLIYMTLLFLSYVFSPYKEEALWGTEGWYMGCIPLLLLCGLSFLLSRLWSGRRGLLHGIIAASGVVFFLAICNRFSFYPIKIEAVQADFISTLGNINWFCGYLSVVAPVGIGLFFLKKEEMSLRKCVLAIYTIVVFMASFCQGSTSIFLWYGALFFLLLWIALEKREWMKNWFLLIILWGIAAQLVRVMRYIMPERYNYDVDNLCGYLTDSGLTLWIVFLASLGYFYIGKKEQTKEKIKVIHRGMVTTLILVLILWAGVSLVNTYYGISGLNENAFFLWNASWGNGRGATLKAGWQTFGELSFLHKLIGIGPDCFSSFAYSLPELASFLREYFGNSRLTNAHCELLTSVIHVGVLGTLCYVGIFASFVYKCLQKGKEQPLLYVFAVCVCGYFAHNMVSFAQVLNIPFLFLILGMGGCILHKTGETR